MGFPTTLVRLRGPQPQNVSRENKVKNRQKKIVLVFLSLGSQTSRISLGLGVPNFSSGRELSNDQVPAQSERITACFGPFQVLCFFKSCDYYVDFNVDFSVDFSVDFNVDFSVDFNVDFKNLKIKK